jgi:CMD domain protein
MTTQLRDIIDELAGIEPGSHLDAVRSLRPEARDNAQKSYIALFEPDDPRDITLEERFAVATFVAGLHRQQEAVGFYAAGLRAHARADRLAAVDEEISRGTGEGPYGRFPTGPLSSEDNAGVTFRTSDEVRTVLGRRLAAAFEHAHLLVFHPRDASRAALQRLLDAGWTIDGIVTLSQLVSYLAFQIRVIAGLRALAKNVALREADVTSLTAALASGGSL